MADRLDQMRDQLSVHAIGEALQHIDADLPRDDWVKVGMALKSEIGAEGFDLFDSWSQGASNYDSRAARDTWKSIRADGGIGIGTLIHMAKAAGWRVPQGAAPQISDAERAERQRKREQRERESAEEKARRNAQAAKDAAEQWEAARAPLPNETHPYAQRKGVQLCGGVRIGSFTRWIEGEDGGDRHTIAHALLIPIRTPEGALVNLQAIFPDAQNPLGRDRDFLPGGRKAGCYFNIGKPAADQPVYICEGYATACSIHAATGACTVVAFDAGNLPSVAQAMRAKLPEHVIVIAADHDRWGKANAGLRKANEAARLVSGLVAIPEGLPEPDTDFNDLAGLHGLDAVQQALSAAQAPPAEDALQAHGGRIGADPANDNAPAPLVPLPSPLEPVERFPLHAMPAAFRPWVEDVAERMQCPADFVAGPMLAGAAMLIARKVAIRPQKHTDWTPRATLWWMAVGRPGAMKSPAMSEALAPLNRLEAIATDSHAQVLVEHRAKEKERKLRAEMAEKDARARLKKNVRADVTDLLQQDEAEAPPRARYIVNDLTYEKLGAIMAENPGGVLSVRDELRGLLAHLSREEQASARAFYLTAWSGGRYAFDRIGRGTVLIPDARLSMVGAIQPGPLADLIQQARRGGMDDGLLQRFLFSWPDENPHWESVDRPPNRDAKRHAWNTFEWLDQFTAVQVGAKVDTGLSGEPEGLPYLRMADDAVELFEEWRTGLERRTRESEGEGMEGALSKFRSHVPALTLVLHLADRGIGSVQADTVRRAICLADYFESHARRVYGIGRRTTVSGARAILRRINAGALKAMFTARDVYRPRWEHLSDRETVDAAIDMLVQHGFLAERVHQSGGRPTTFYWLTEAGRAHA